MTEQSKLSRRDFLRLGGVAAGGAAAVAAGLARPPVAEAASGPIPEEGAPTPKIQRESPGIVNVTYEGQTAFRFEKGEGVYRPFVAEDLVTGEQRVVCEYNWSEGPTVAYPGSLTAEYSERRRSIAVSGELSQLNQGESQYYDLPEGVDYVSRIYLANGLPVAITDSLPRDKETYQTADDLYFWNKETGQFEAVSFQSRSLEVTEYSPEDKSLVVIDRSKEEVVLVDPDQREKKATFEKTMTAAVRPTDNKLCLVSNKGEITVAGQEETVGQLPLKEVSPFYFYNLKFTPDAKNFVIAGDVRAEVPEEILERMQYRRQAVADNVLMVGDQEGVVHLLAVPEGWWIGETKVENGRVTLIDRSNDTTLPYNLSQQEGLMEGEVILSDEPLEIKDGALVAENFDGRAWKIEGEPFPGMPALEETLAKMKAYQEKNKEAGPFYVRFEPEPYGGSQVVAIGLAGGNGGVGTKANRRDYRLVNARTEKTS